MAQGLKRSSVRQSGAVAVVSLLKRKRSALNSWADDQVPHQACTSDTAAASSHCVGRKTDTSSSLFQILRDNCRIRLYVPPIQWTAAHLDLLGCGFVRETPTPSAKRPRYNTSTPCDDTRWMGALEAANHLRRTEFEETQVTMLMEIIAKLGPDLKYIQSTLPLWFQDKRVTDISVGALFGSPPCGATVACMRLGAIRAARRATVYGRANPYAKSNPVTAALRRKALRSVVPADRVLDPYIAGVLIAMAQSEQRSPRFSRLLTELEGSPGFEEALLKIPTPALGPYKVNVLALDGRVVHIYSADIPGSFLDRFDRPHERVPSPEVLVSVESLPLSRAKSLIQRLQAVLGR